MENTHALTRGDEESSALYDMLGRKITELTYEVTGHKRATEDYNE